MPLIAFANLLEPAREAGTSRFSAARIADALGVQHQDLAALAGVHRNTLRAHPESPRLQAALRDLMRVLSAATAVQPDTTGILHGQERTHPCVPPQGHAAVGV